MTDDSNSFDSKFLDDPQFQSLLIRCLETLQQGEKVEPDAIAAEYPSYAEEIRRFLSDRKLLEQAAAQFNDERQELADPSGFQATIDSRSPASPWSSGDMVRYIGEFEILDEIARGGMGIVFKARQANLQRIVALKMILAGRLADAADVERFQREARAAGQLKHPNIVPVHEIGEHDDRHYFTMDFVDGPSLADEIREESLQPSRAAAIVKATAQAIQYAHNQGTVHRDLKPANILLTNDRTPHITDFGLAKMLRSVGETSSPELTAAGQILGTPSYMSPEQAAGKHELVGPAADIYSLGAILYACLTGRPPFIAESPVDTLMQVIRKDPVSPRELNPSVPKDLETICLKCLSKEPQRRYRTAGDVANDLGRFLEGRPVLARPMGPVGRYYRWCQRNPAIAALSVLLFASLAVGALTASTFAVAATRQANLAKHQQARAEESRELAVKQKHLADQARLEAEKQRDAALAAKAQAEWLFSQQADARRMVDSARPSESGSTDGELDLSSLDNMRLENADKRADVLQSLAKMGPDAAFAVQKLIPMLHRPDSYEKILVIRCLGRIGPAAADAAPSLNQILMSESSLAAPRAEAGQALARLGKAGEVAIPTLIEMLKKPGSEVKLYLAKPSHRELDASTQLLTRTDEKGAYTQIRDIVQMQTISSLAKFGPAAKDAIPTIKDVLDDPKTLEGVRVVAVAALQSIESNN